MTAQYGLFRNPPHKGEKESDILHARIIPGRTIRIDRVTREISECTSFSPGDVKGLLQALPMYSYRIWKMAMKLNWKVWDIFPSH